MEIYCIQFYCLFYLQFCYTNLSGFLVHCRSILELTLSRGLKQRYLKWKYMRESQVSPSTHSSHLLSLEQTLHLSGSDPETSEQCPHSCFPQHHLRVGGDRKSWSFKCICIAEKINLHGCSVFCFIFSGLSNIALKLWMWNNNYFGSLSPRKCFLFPSEQNVCYHRTSLEGG